MKLMYDSATARNISTNAKIVGGYINGKYTWLKSDWNRFPNATKIRIAVYIPGTIPPNSGDVLDMEASDAPSPFAQRVALQWCNNRRLEGIVPTIYTSKSTAHFFTNCKADMWLADYTHSPHLLPDSCATQYDNPGPFDVSLCADWWPRIKESPLMPSHSPVSVTSIAELPIPQELGGGAWLLQADGAVFAFPIGRPNFGGTNGKSYFQGRVADDIVSRDVPLSDVSSANPPYAIIATSGERYGDGGF